MRLNARRLLNGLAGLLLLLGLVACTQVASPPPPGQTRPVAWGYVAWWVPQAWINAPLNRMERVLFFEIRMERDGSVRDMHGWPGAFPELRALVQQHRIPLDLTLTLHDLGDFNSLFRSAEAIARFLGVAERLASDPGVSGVQLDVEIYEHPDQNALVAFRRFTAELGDRLAAMKPPRVLSVFLPIGAEQQIYDRDSLRRVGYAVLQGYDAHWQGSPTSGPIAPLTGPWRMTWGKALTEAARLGLDKKRILMGYPLYGYQWSMRQRGLYAQTSGPGEVVTLAPQLQRPGNKPTDNVRDKIKQHGCGRDPYIASSFYEYQKPDGQWVTGWFEGPADLDRKHRFLMDQGVRGTAFFALGYDGYVLVDRFVGRNDRLAAGGPLDVGGNETCSGCGLGCGS